MEAATPLRRPRVRVAADRVLVDGVVIADACAVRLVSEREEAGDDPVATLLDAVEIGARVLDREQAAANADFVRTEFEKASREVETAFAQRAEQVSERLSAQLEEVFGPESGHLSKALERHFSDDSSGAVQHRVRTVVGEVMQRSREDLLRQFSAADGQNPLADFKVASVRAIRQMGDQQGEALRAMGDKVSALQLEVQRLQGEREKQLELAVERARGTAKGRSYEEAVFEAVDAIAVAQGDDAEAVGDLKGATRKTGDVVVGIDGCRGPARGRVVFEAKDSKLSKPEAVRQLDRAMAERGADYAVLVVPGEDALPAKTTALREINGDKLVVAYDPEEGSRLALEVAYALARARVVVARGGGDGLDAGALAEAVERTLTAMGDVRAVKQQLTGATTSIDKAREVLEAMAARVRAHLEDL
ncbi:MAG: hypothetical protein ACR2ML_02655, partial [Solirubrobacteraceae bacterium]